MQQGESTKDRWISIQADPELIQTICAHISSGGTLVSLAEIWGVPYGWVTNWISISAERSALFDKAKQARNEWCFDAVMREVQRVALADIRNLYDDTGALRHPKDWPDDIAAAVSAVQVDDIYEGTGHRRKRVGESKKVVLWNKMKGLELLGKTMRMFVDVHEHKVARLEDLVVEASQPMEGSEHVYLTGDVDNVAEDVDNSSEEDTP